MSVNYCQNVIPLPRGETARHWLNNIAQHFRLGKVEYTRTTTGPEHAITWSVTVSVGGFKYGQGTGANEATAKEMAASEAVSVLRQRGYTV